MGRVPVAKSRSKSLHRQIREDRERVQVWVNWRLLGREATARQHGVSHSTVTRVVQHVEGTPELYELALAELEQAHTRNRALGDQALSVVLRRLIADVSDPKRAIPVRSLAASVKVLHAFAVPGAFEGSLAAPPAPTPPDAPPPPTTPLLPPCLQVARGDGTPQPPSSEPT
jgi:hypothetical protein